MSILIPISIDAMPDEQPWWYHLENDPLSNEQKKKIKAFVDEHLLKTETEVVQRHHLQNPACRRIDKLDGEFEAFKALWKTYTTPALQTAKEKLEEREFNSMRQVLIDPANEADKLGLDPSSSGQIFAARMLMNAAIRRIQCHGDYDKMLGIYRDKMATNRNGTVNDAISVENKMLIANDPIQKLDLSKQNHNALDLVLAHIHFKEPRQVNQTYDGNQLISEEVRGPTREKARAMYKHAFTKLWQSSDTKYIIEGLAALIRKEKAEIFFSQFPAGVGELGIPYRASSNALGGIGGFYAGHHSIFMASLIHPYESSIQLKVLGTFVHEAQHFLFDKIVQNQSSPVRPASQEEKRLDEALRLDQEHRKTMGPLSGRQSSVRQTFVNELEQDREYFPGGFDASKPHHLHTMRMEAIVRIVEQLAEGVSHEDIQAVAPNLYAFYFQYSKPLIEKFVGENSPSLEQKSGPSKVCTIL